jgi:YesN/AraC family two-component response regulator
METQQGALLGKRILLVDDERSVRETLRSLLCHDDHEVVEANNGAEALRLFAQDQFDLVLTDLRMPFVEGDELATDPHDHRASTKAGSYQPGQCRLA